MRDNQCSFMHPKQHWECVLDFGHVGSHTPTATPLPVMKSAGEYADKAEKLLESVPPTASEASVSNVIAAAHVYALLCIAAKTKEDV